MGVDLWAEPAIAGVLGLLLGSFLNVVIYRLPVMMERQWRQEAAELLSEEPVSTSPSEKFNLMVPRSRCPHCGHHMRISAARRIEITLDPGFSRIELPRAPADPPV